MTVESAQVSVTDTATSIHEVTVDPGGGTIVEYVTVKNAGDADVFLGGPGVTTSNGYKLASGDVLPLDMKEGEELFGIVASDSESVHKLVTKK